LAAKKPALQKLTISLLKEDVTRAGVAPNGEFTQLLSASDATYQSGYLGIAGGGNFARLANFRGAQLPPF
jgi:hypothetical protein